CDEGDVERLLRKAIPLLVGAACHRTRGCGASVKAVLQCDNLAATRHFACEPERVLVGFRGRVDEEDGIQTKPADRRQLGCCATAHLERYRIALETERACLCRQRFDPPRMVVTARGNGVPAV